MEEKEVIHGHNCKMKITFFLKSQLVAGFQTLSQSKKICSFEYSCGSSKCDKTFHDSIQFQIWEELYQINCVKLFESAPMVSIVALCVQFH